MIFSGLRSEFPGHHIFRPSRIRDVLDIPDGADEWPSDEVFRRNWIGRQFYGYFKRDRVLMIL